MGRRLLPMWMILLQVSASAAASAGGYPRIANLWGVGPEATEYDRWARYGLLVMPGGSPEAFRIFSREVRRRNPQIVLLGSAPLVNLGTPAGTPWMKDAWFLRRPDGKKVEWWAGQVYVPNLFIDDCLNALVEQTAGSYGALLKERVLDGLFYDSVVGSVTWLGEVDTNGDGKADVADEVNPRWLKRQCEFFGRLRQRWPGVVIMANDVEASHRVQVNGRLFEGATLLDRAIDGSEGAKSVIDSLNAWTRESVQPGLTFALMTHPLGWEGWRVGKGDKVTTPGEVDRVRRDFRRVRFGLATTLMSDAFYAYDVGTVWYGLKFWYAEYDAPLGKPVGAAREVFEVPPQTVFEWRAGQDAEGLQPGTGCRVRPEGILVEEKDPASGWRCVISTDVRKVRLDPGGAYRIEADCVVPTKATGAFQFTVRTGKGGWEHHDKGVALHSGPSGTPWPIRCDVVLDGFDDYAVQWHHLGAGVMRLEGLRIQLIRRSYWLREFEGGAAVLNPTPWPVVARLPRPMRRLSDPAAPRQAIEVDDLSKGFSCQGAWEVVGGEVPHYGATWRRAAKPGDRARWDFSAPATDTYEVFACVPGGRRLTDAAAYHVEGAAESPAVTISQRDGDGGWMRLFGVRLTAGQRCGIVLVSGGAGAAAADAVRIESAARTNDGAVVEQLPLDPFDGAVVVK